MYYTVYKITNLINNKCYIGKHQTKKLDDDYMGSGKAIKTAISKYGLENFKKEILFIFDNHEDMSNKEKELVTEEFCLLSDNYNLVKGGNGGFNYINEFKIPKFKGRTHTDKTKEKLRVSNLGNQHGLGYKHTDDAKRRIGENSKKCLTGKPKSIDHKNKIAQINVGRKQSADAIANRFASRKGYSHTLETREKLRQTRIGKVMAEETKRAISKANKQFSLRKKNV